MNWLKLLSLNHIRPLSFSKIHIIPSVRRHVPHAKVRYLSEPSQSELIVTRVVIDDRLPKHVSFVSLHLLNSENSLLRIRPLVVILHPLLDLGINRVATLTLMLSHIPLRNVSFAALFTDKGSYPLMLPHVHLEVRPGVVPLIATGHLTVELVDILMSLFVIFQDPELPIGICATRKTAPKLISLILHVCGQMVLQMLGHLEGLIAALVSAKVQSYLKVTLQVLLLLGILIEYFLAPRHRTVNEATALLGVVIVHLESVSNLDVCRNRLHVWRLDDLDPN